MGVLQDLRYAVRVLIKDKWFTAVAALALALGIGANNAVFTFVNAVLIRGVPFDDPDRIISIGVMDNRGLRGSLAISRLDFLDIREQSRSFDQLSMVLPSPTNVSDEGMPAEQFQGTFNSSNLFRSIGQHPVIGRDFLPVDDTPNGEPVVIIGSALWKNRYGSDPGIIGRAIRINSRPMTVIGVMPPDFRFPLNNDLWLPLSQLPPEVINAKRGVRNVFALGHLAAGVTLPQASAEIERIVARLARDYPESDKDLRASVVTYNERLSQGPIRLVFLSLMGAVVFVLLIACANVANLLLARATARSREIAVRVSLGASRWQIVRQLLVESLLLAVISGIAGFGLSVIGVRLFDAATSAVGRPYWMKFTMDGTVLVFLVGVSIATGVLFGLAPALHVSKTDVNEVMKEAGGRSGTGGVRARRWTGALIVAEIALTLVLLAGAGFMMRSFMALYRMDIGFDTTHVLSMRVFLPLERYQTREVRTTLFQHIEERLGAVGGIQAAALASAGPLSGGVTRQLSVEGRPPNAGERPPEITMVTISPRYFQTLGSKLIRGRPFDATDGTRGHESAIVNQRFVAMHFPGEDPIGRRITLVDGSPGLQQSPTVTASIVGIAPTVRQRNVSEPDPDPVVYLPYRSDPQRGVLLLVRTPGDPAAATALVREQMREIEPDLPLFQIQTMDQYLALQRWPFRVFGTMFAIFAFIALVLSAVGLYAVTSYSVSQRTQEIGVRMALGAQAEQVWWLVLRRSFAQLAIGLPVGVAGALGVGRLLQTVLVQTSTRDPLTIAAIAVLMVVVSLAACFWPARRATRLDPVSALRYE